MDYLLRGCPPLKILTTSRATLNLGGEHVFIIPPLALPEAALTADPAGLLAFDSVTLLLDRARALSNFRITPENAGAVASLCRGLEGMPLAIELAAAQLGVLTVHQILEHMNQSLELLAGGIGGTTERQWATLKEAINLSYGMLNAEQSIFFRRLSIFHRGWTWEAAVEICREKPQNEFDVLRLMNQLHRMSLIVVEEKAGQKRFRHPSSFSRLGPRKKPQGSRRVLRLHCLGGRLLRRLPARTIGEPPDALSSPLSCVRLGLPLP